MISLKLLKDGNVAFVFGKEFAEQAKQMYPFVAMALVNKEANDLMLNGGSQPRALLGVKNRVEGKTGGSSEITLRLNEPVDVKFSLKSLARQKHEINKLICEMCEKFGLKWGQAWDKAYRILLVKDGYDVRAKGPCRLTGREGKTLINRVLKDGKGEVLIKLLSDLLDK